ncbi:TIGR02270 family protein [Marinimicrobium alkaliphilum]|uniref:TIGR02270 family protein n=1 Tax=Marinimicrobium alkaliphilum TaxID=2202654 RepID=UPI000DBA87E5|nr:TIGR02270 family protein [Marinimicrobium alkaliphilum]
MTLALKARQFSHVIEQHLESAAFLWLLRAQAVNQSHHTPDTLARLESRIDKHLKGLYLAPAIAWECTLEAARDFQEPGELFVLTSLALHADCPQKIALALAMSAESDEGRKAAVSALGWQDSARVYPHLRAWVTSTDPYLRYLALSTSSIRRLDPKTYLNQALQDSADLTLLARALRLAGELGRCDVRALLAHCFDHDDQTVAFWAHWSAALLGEAHHWEGFSRFVTEPGPFQERAIALAFRALPIDRAWALINELINSHQDQQAIIALGALGDPRAAGWLLTRMDEPQLNAIAGESFTLITGLRANTETSPAQDDDKDTDLAPIEGYDELPPADGERLAALWHSERPALVAGQRHILGQPREPTRLDHLLNHGHQKQRLGAALDLALIGATPLLVNAKARQAVAL